MLQKRIEKTADSQINLKSANLRFNIIHLVCHSERISTKFALDFYVMTKMCRNYPTKLIILPGTIITLFGVLPCNWFCVLSSAITISSI